MTVQELIDHLTAAVAADPSIAAIPAVADCPIRATEVVGGFDYPARHTPFHDASCHEDTSRCFVLFVSTNQ